MTALFTLNPSILLTIEPTVNPARSAAAPGVKLKIRAPFPVYAESNVTPKNGFVDFPVAINSSAIRIAWLNGIENPSPIFPGVPIEEPVVAIAELTPIALPWESTSGPPEFPGLIAASVWIASI